MRSAETARQELPGLLAARRTLLEGAAGKVVPDLDHVGHRYPATANGTAQDSAGMTRDEKQDVGAIAFDVVEVSGDVCKSLMNGGEVERGGHVGAGGTALRAA